MCSCVGSELTVLSTDKGTGLLEEAPASWCQDDLQDQVVLFQHCPCCVTWGKLLNLSVPHVLTSQIGVEEWSLRGSQ